MVDLLEGSTDTIAFTVFLCALVAAVVSAVYTSLTGSRRRLEAERVELNRRISSLEILQAGDFPRWTRDADKTIISVTPQFVTLFGTPVGYTEQDFKGKKFSDLQNFSPSLIATLDDLDASLCAGRKYASACGVEVFPGVKVTILKAALSAPHGTIFVGYAVPEVDKRSQS